MRRQSTAPEICPPGKILSQSDALSYWQQHSNLPKPGTLGSNGQPIVVVEYCGTYTEQTAPLTFKAGTYANLDIADMSTQDLMKHGIPLPDAARGSKAWDNWLVQMSSELPRMYGAMPLYLKESTPNLTDTSYQSTNWSGYLDGTNSPSDYYTFANVDVTVPSVSEVSPLPDVLGIWTGIGGFNGFGQPSDLVQAGTNVTINTSGAVQDWAFWEYVQNGSGPPDQEVFFVNPGDSVIAQISWIIGDQYYYTVDDQTTGQSASGDIFTGWSTQNPNSAEFIVEGNINSYKIPSFSYVPITQACSREDTTSGPCTSGEDQQPWDYVYERSSMGNLTPTSWQTTSSFDVNDGTSSTYP